MKILWDSSKNRERAQDYEEGERENFISMYNLFGLVIEKHS